MAKSSKNRNHEEWSELKHLLLEEEKARIQKIEEKVIEPEDFADSMAEVLPEAVQKTKDKSRLSKKLYPVVEESLYRSVKTNPDSLADAIYPVMAPAIRKAINEALKKVTESVNSSVNSGLSMKTLKWRLQALFSSESFGDIVLKSSLLYQVQELYLIHNDTGLLIAHLSQKTGDNPDGDMISGMLTAIKDFVTDSFNVEKGETLETIQVGGLVVLIEQGPHASLACVVKGDPSTDLRDNLNQTVEKIHQEFGPELKNFNGDTSVLEETTLIIAPCLITKLDQDESEGSGKTGLIIGVIGFIILLCISYNVFWGVTWKNLSKRIDHESRYEVVIKDRKWHNFTMIATSSSTKVPKYESDPDSLSYYEKLGLTNFEDILDFHLRKGQHSDSMSAIGKFMYEKKIKFLSPIALSSSSFSATLQLVNSKVQNDPSVIAREGRTFTEINEDPSYINIKSGDTIWNKKPQKYFLSERIILVEGETDSLRVIDLKKDLPRLSDEYIIDVENIRVKGYVEKNDTIGIRDTLIMIENQLDRLLLFFQVATDELLPGQESKTKQLKNYLTKADSICQIIEESRVLEISGSTDPTGSVIFNQELEKQRSFYIVDKIIPEDMKNIIVIWKGSSAAKRKRIEALIENERQKRHVSFELKNVNEP